MKQNESTLDRTIRIVAGLIILFLYFTGRITGTLGIILLIVAVVLLITGAIGYCGLYDLFKIKTK